MQEVLKDSGYMCEGRYFLLATPLKYSRCAHVQELNNLCSEQIRKDKIITYNVH